MHTPDEARRLLREAACAAWMRKRQRAGEPPHVRKFVSAHRHAQLTSCFDALDVDGSGKVALDELRFSLSALGLDGSRAVGLVRAGDTDGDNELDLEEWLALVATITSHAAQRDACKRAQRRPAQPGDGDAKPLLGSARRGGDMAEQGLALGEVRGGWAPSPAPDPHTTR